jgi:hypothetical protein
MKEPSYRNPSISRWKEVEGLAHKFINFMATGDNGNPIDSDGYTLVVFNDKVSITDNVSDPSILEPIFKSGYPPGGGTDLAYCLTKVQELRAHPDKKGKPSMLWIYTDGAPTNAPAALSQMAKMTQTMQKKSDLAFLIIQVGNDGEAASFLKTIDDELVEKYKAKFDAGCCIASGGTIDSSFQQLAYMAFNG